MGKITRYVATAVFAVAESKHSFEQKLQESLWLATWKEVFKNGVIRYDLIDLKSGEALTLDAVPVYPEKVSVSQVRMISDEKDTVQEMVDFCKAHVGLKEEPEVHEVSVGIRMR